ncbi:hypothetical protein [Egicoccus halophilus]|uniref:Uncharacterized protein n=1 Tax=Egicoccus halophilus TaxID=1670830 RepID=A0A8J3EXX8_9ACTN|nr:hypothetical protein [Egicoccus halophilus]GGI06733.1 hypothetical protein GCM10011354_20570 [Egicoccus halophilus]
MSRTQTSETTRARRGPATPVPGATFVAEASTAQAALAEVHATYGAGARILAAKRVLRGGFAGFFAKEVVQIHAAEGERPAPAVPPASAVAPTVAPATVAPAAPVAGPAVAEWEPTPSASPIDRLLADADEAPEEVDFATFLRRQLVPQQAAVAAAPAPAAAPAVTVAAAPAPTVAAAALAATPAGHPSMTPVTWPTADAAAVARPRADEFDRPAWADAPAGAVVVPREAAPGAQTVATAAPTLLVVDEPMEPTEGRVWSRTSLIRLGLPVDFVQSLAVAEPADDLAWTFALAESLRPLCRPLPSGRSLLVGPRARGLARTIGMPVANLNEPVLALGDVAAAVTGSPRSLEWMERARTGRWLHLVVGGKGWRDLLHADPLAASWASQEFLPDAIRAALELGLVLGYGPARASAERAQPLDVALAIRDMVPFR